MSKVAGVGSGTFAFIFVAVFLLIVIILLHNSKIGQIIFWGGLVVSIITFSLLAVSPTKDDPVEEDINELWYILLFFSIFIILGFVVAIVAYLLVVLLYQDFAIVIPT